MFGTGFERHVQIEGLASDGYEGDAADPVDGVPVSQVALGQLHQPGHNKPHLLVGFPLI